MPANFKVLFHAELILTGLEEMLDVFNGFFKHIKKPDDHDVILADAGDFFDLCGQSHMFGRGLLSQGRKGDFFKRLDGTYDVLGQLIKFFLETGNHSLAFALV